MRLHPLKSLRVGLSVAFFALIALLFLDLHNVLAPALAGDVLYLQFVPSLVRFMEGATLGAAGCIVIVVLTLLSGRVYCSTICPLGTLQDMVGFVARKRGKRRGFRFSEPKDLLRYAVLASTTLLLVAGSGFLLNLLDPFSVFGRIFTNLVRPVVLLVNNAAAIALEQLGVYALPRERWAAIAWLSAGVSTAMLGLVAWLAATRGRLYCNTACPLGALLGLLSRVSFVRIGIDPESCKDCRRCEGACKAGCIDLGKKRVDFSRCVGCCNCLSVCPRQGIRLEFRWRRRAPAPRPDSGRRGFLLNSGLYLLSFTGIPEETMRIIRSRPTTVPVRVTSHVSPPGSGSIARFTATCTACHLCVSACPSRVLVPSFLEFGFLGMMQPRMDYRAGYCNYECAACLEICPTGAILPLTRQEKKLTQLGVAKFIKENCVVLTDNTVCGACSEHCPTKAVSMVPYPNPANKPLTIPEVKQDYCIGCGACEHACPTRPYRAIFVDGNPVHRPAKQPVVQLLDVRVDDSGEFPF